MDIYSQSVVSKEAIIDFQIQRCLQALCRFAISEYFVVYILKVYGERKL